MEIKYLATLNLPTVYELVYLINVYWLEFQVLFNHFCIDKSLSEKLTSQTNRQNLKASKLNKQQEKGRERINVQQSYLNVCKPTLNK